MTAVASLPPTSDQISAPNPVAPGRKRLFFSGVPVVLAPMAGITNTAFRRLCREQMAPERGLFVSEMITTRALVERNPKTMHLIRFEADEQPRSIQLYGVDPDVVGAAVRMIVADDLADHIDVAHRSVRRDRHCGGAIRRRVAGHGEDAGRYRP